MYHPHEKTVDAVFEMMRSLQLAIKDSGGNITVTPKFVEETTVKQLMLLLASNKIRFTCDSLEKMNSPVMQKLPDPVEYVHNKRPVDGSFDDDADY